MKRDKFYLSELFDMSKIKNNNIIISPVGSGKTEFIFNKLIPRYNGKKLYLCDNCNLEEQVLNSKRKETFSRKSEYENEFIDSETQVEVVCYNSFAKRVANLDICESMKIFEKYDLIIADEIHSLVDYQNFTDSKNLWRLMELLFTKEYENATIVLLTATPYYIENIQSKFPSTLSSFEVFDFDENKNIVRYINKRKVYINHISQIETQLKQYREGFEYGGLKCLIYIKTISDIKKIETMCKRINLNPISIWSKNNTKHILNEKQEEARKYLLQTGYVIEPYNVIIINKSMETGVNIKDKDIELVVINTTNITEQIQARGRVRHDIDLIIVRTKNPAQVMESQIINLPKKWLDIPLTRIDKAQLCKEFNLYNEARRQLKWTTVKEILLNNGYIIKKVKPVINGKQVNCEIIKK